MSMRTKYDALPFDPDDSRDVLAETGRRMLIETAIAAVETKTAPDGEHLQYLLGGLMVGIVQIAVAHIESDDDGWASVRAAMLQMTPWAVDQARSIVDLPPLPEA